MRSTIFISALALCGTSLAKNGCSKNGSKYTKDDAYYLLREHLDSSKATHAPPAGTSYSWKHNTAQVCLRNKAGSGGPKEDVSNGNIARTMTWTLSDCCDSTSCYNGWAEYHVKGDYELYVNIISSLDDCNKY